MVEASDIRALGEPLFLVSLCVCVTVC